MLSGRSDETERGEATYAAIDRDDSLVSLAHGAEHPLSGLHLHRMEQTRDGLAALLKSS